MHFIIFFIITFLALLKWVIIFDILFSIFRVSKKNRFYFGIRQILQPFYFWVRKIPHKIGFFDLAPLYLFFAIDLLHYFLTAKF
ncbi:YggT family protein [Candidatus Gracilibacteria bacterium]|nr:YggT family protein [Candidatus Gracilibacteria bacterium]